MLFVWRILSRQTAKPAHFSLLQLSIPLSNKQCEVSMNVILNMFHCKDSRWLAIHKSNKCSLSDRCGGSGFSWILILAMPPGLTKTCSRRHGAFLRSWCNASSEAVTTLWSAWPVYVNSNSRTFKKQQILISCRLLGMNVMKQNSVT